MNARDRQLSWAVELKPGERLTLPESIVESVGEGRWTVTVQPSDPSKRETIPLS